ncbi:MAG: glycosyltransferase, partial [Euryarchaeota archaeon]|nr:glycosyltransferase [Euryarchaeota archaeon]
LLGLNGRLLERRLAGRPGLRVNFSQTTWLPADIWWIMGRPLGTTIRTIQPSLTPSLRRMASLAAPPIGLVDGRHFWKMAHGVRRIYTNSTANALWFLSRGVEVHGVLPHFLQSHAFAPTSAQPSRSYILVYLGKETDVEAVKLLFQLDYPIKVFGSKSAGWVEGGLKGSRRGKVEMLGRVSDEELKSLYTHALFTAFPFTEEPFGLVPVESMACGTPVLTYGRQGPGETVIDGWTGWLVENASQFVIKAHEICRRGYAATMGENCRERSRFYGLETVAELWSGVIRSLINGTSAPDAVGAALRGLRSTSAIGGRVQRMALDIRSDP